MSLFGQPTLKVFHDPAAAEAHDYTSVIRRSREDPERTNITPLRVLAGRRFVQQAHLFFEELQPSLSSLSIRGQNVDEFWCMLDWQRYILAVWIKQFRDASNVKDTMWIEIKESWVAIIQATVAIILRYASPLRRHQRSTNSNRRLTIENSTESLTFKKSVANSWNRRGLNQDDARLVNSIVDASREKVWELPFLYDLAFTGIIESVRDNLTRTPLSVLTESQRHLMESSEPRGLIQVLAKRIKLLIDVLPPSSQDALHEAFNRALRNALSDRNENHTIRSLHFHHTLLSQWPSQNPALEVENEMIFHARVQQTFGDVIAPSRYSRLEDLAPYTVKDLSDILALGADLRGVVEGDQKDCCLWAAAKSTGSIQVFEALIHAGAPYVNKPHSGTSPLQAAIEADNMDIVTFLLNSKQHNLTIDINASDRWGRTALHEAARDCNEAVVNLLLHQRGINADCPDNDGYTPLQVTIQSDIASHSKKYATIKTLLRCSSIDPSFEVPDTWRNRKTLHIAAESRDASLSLIIRRFRDINASNLLGETPLHKAVECNSKPNISTLLQHGADPTIVSKDGLTPLLLGCKLRHLGSMKVLLGLPHALTAQCPFPVGQGHYGHFSPVTLVLDSISNFGKRSMEHVNLALKIILDAKPDLEVREADGRSVLSSVVNTVDESMLLNLLRAGADVNSKDEKGRTPLHHLLGHYCPNEKANMVKLLFEYGADLDVQDAEGVPAVPLDWEEDSWDRGLGRDVVRVIRDEKARRERMKQKRA